MTTDPKQPTPPRWLHWWAVLTVIATLPLLFLGAEVTTKGVGMADPLGYRHPWEIIQAFGEANFGLRIEYSHRLAGFTVGTLALALAALLWLFEPRRWVRWAGTLALTLVIVQGLLGRFRVDLNALFGQNLAMLHGCFAQLVIASLVSVALFTSRSWTNSSADTPATPALRRWSLLMTLFVYGQLVLGGLLRHKDFLLGSRLHVIGAFVVFGTLLWLSRLVRESERYGDLKVSLRALHALVGLQILVGVETWMFRSQVYFQQANLSMHADWVRSLHYVVGTLIFSASVVLAWQANRRPVALPSPAPVKQLEAVA